MDSILPPEARLVLLATRADSLEVHRDIVALCAQQLDWGRVGELAEREKLVPVLWARLGEGRRRIPDAMGRRLHAQATVTEFRMSLAETTLADCLARLHSAGIEVMLLKGAALALTVYGGFTDRPMGDLDILVRPDQAERAWQLLRDAGWQLEFERGGEFYSRHHHLAALVAPGGLPLVMEVHRMMMPAIAPFLIDPEAPWRTARRVELRGHRALVPSDEYQLLHLSVHLAWSNMLILGLGRTVRDVTMMAAARTIDWDAFASLAEQAKAATCAYWTLELARTLGGAEVPAEVTRRLRRSVGARPVELLARSHVATAMVRNCPSVHLARGLWVMAIRPGASGHGRARPWQVGEDFAASMHLPPQAGLAKRLRAHLKLWGAWLRFVGVLALPRRLT